MRKKTTDYEISRIIDLYKPSNKRKKPIHNAAEASRLLKEEGIMLSRVVVKNHWKKKGYELNPHGGRREALKGGRGAVTKEEGIEILTNYFLNNGNIVLTAEKLGYHESTVKRLVEKYGLPSLGTRTREKKNEKDLPLEERLIHDFSFRIEKVYQAMKFYFE